jgi:hypothetical protein
MMTLQTDDEDPDAYIIGEEHKNSQPLKEAIAKMNELKYSCGEDIQAAHAIEYLVLDIRGDKRSNKYLTPEKIDLAFKRNGK